MWFLRSEQDPFSYHTMAALLVFFIPEKIPSAFVGPWLPIPDGTVLQQWKWSRIEMDRSCLIFFDVMVILVVDAALKGSLCLGSCQTCEDAANAADSSPDAPQCQANILAISAADVFFSIVYDKQQSFNRQGSKIWIGFQDASLSIEVASFPNFRQDSPVSATQSVNPVTVQSDAICGKISMKSIHWKDLKYLKASKRKIGNRIRLSNSQF